MRRSRVSWSTAANGSSSSSTSTPTMRQAGERDALLHAAGEVARIGVLEAAQADQVEQLVGLSLGARVELLAELRRQQRVLERGAPRKQGRALEHQRDVLPRLGDLAAVHRDPSVRERDQAGDEAQQSGLAAAARAHDRDELAGGRLEADVVHCQDAAVEPLHGLRDRDASARAIECVRPSLLLSQNLLPPSRYRCPWSALQSFAVQSFAILSPGPRNRQARLLLSVSYAAAGAVESRTTRLGSRRISRGGESASWRRSSMSSPAAFPIS